MKLDKVVWAEGVMLTQQHFQAWDYSQSKLHSIWQSMLHAYPWGVDSVSWDTTEIINNRINLTELKVVFPDGRLIEYQSKDSEKIEFIFDDSIGDQAIIYVAIANNNLVDGITGYDKFSAPAAWKGDYQKIVDMYDSKREEEILFARPNLLLITSEDINSNLVNIPIALVKRSSDGGYELNNKWQPCLIKLNKNTASFDTLKEVQQLLLHRVSIYQEKRRNLGDLSSFSSVELAGFMLQKDLAVYLTDLTSLLEQGGGQPYAVFLLFNRLLTQLSLYVGVETKQQDYKHTNQIVCFQSQVNEIKSLLERLSYEQDTQLRLKLNEQGVLVTTKHNIKDFNKVDLYLAINLPGLSQSMLDNFPDFCKVAAVSAIDSLIESAMPGLFLRYCKRIPAKIRQKSGYEYFSIEKDSDLWTKLVEEKSVAVFCTGDFAESQIELLAIDSV